MKTKLICLLVLSLFVFFSCKKYKEGPLLSLRSKNNRATSRWEMQGYFINEQDCTLKVNPGGGKYNFVIEDLSKRHLHHFYADYFFINGEWEFTDKKKKIRFYNTNNLNGIEYGVFLSDDITWRMMRMTKKEFFLETDFNGNHYRAELKSIGWQ